MLMCFFFFFNDTATTEIYTLSLHDALPIFRQVAEQDEARAPRERQHRQVVRPHPQRDARHHARRQAAFQGGQQRRTRLDRKSTRLNSSHANISYAVFCLKKKKNTSTTISIC